jgi:hypothetical protein
MITLVGQTVTFLVSLAALAFQLDGCLAAGVRTSVASRAPYARSARRLIFEARRLADDPVTLEFDDSRERARYHGDTASSRQRRASSFQAGDLV